MADRSGRVEGRPTGVAAGVGAALGRSALVEPFRSPAYRSFWLGNALVQAGDQLQIVALAILALDLSRSPATLGLILAAQAVPRTLLMLLGGVAADRVRPRSVLIAAWTGLAVLGGALTTSLATGQIALWQLYAYGAAVGVLYAFVMPAQQAIVASLVPGERLRNALALNSMTFNLMMFLVPPAAGVLVSQAGVTPAFALMAGCCAAGALCLSAVRPVAARAAPAGSPLAQLREGLTIVRLDALLPIAIGAAWVFSLGFTGVTQVGVPALAKLDLGAGDPGIGVLFGAMGGGALLGAIAVGALPRLPRQGLVAASTLVAMGVCLAAVAVAPTVAAAAVGLFASGVARAFTAVTFLTLVQTQAPAEARGRVMALFMLGVNGLAPLSLSLGGLLAEAFGSRGVFVAGGAAIAAAGVLCLARPAFRRAS
jgi:MFS family permease